MPTLVIVVLLGLLGGLAVGLQGPLASLMTQRLGLLESIFIVHIGGALAVTVPLLLRGGGNLGEFRSVPGTPGAGLMGLIILGAVSYTIPRSASRDGDAHRRRQLTLGVALDHFGLLGAEVRPPRRATVDRHRRAVRRRVLIVR